MITPMPAEDYARNARYVRNHDGDTVTLTVALGFGVTIGEELALRVLGVNSPELGTPGGAEARDFVAAWFAQAGPESWPFRVLSVKWDKYGGRYDGHVWRRSDGVSLADALLAAGHAVPYDGGKR